MERECAQSPKSNISIIQSSAPSTKASEKARNLPKFKEKQQKSRVIDREIHKLLTIIVLKCFIYVEVLKFEK